MLLIPLAMTILDRNKAEGDGWRWTALDFVVMGALLFGAGIAYEFISSKLVRKGHKIMLGFAILFVVFVIWVELAVGGVSKLLAYFLS